MGKTALGALAGVIGWVVVASLLNLGMRMGWPGYAAVEKSFDWTLGMQCARLLVGAAASLAAGYVAMRIAPKSRAALFAGIVLLVLFLPIHYMEFSKMPLWYHAAFLLTLVPIVLGGSKLAGGTRAG